MKEAWLILDFLNRWAIHLSQTQMPCFYLSSAVSNYEHMFPKKLGLLGIVKTVETFLLPRHKPRNEFLTIKEKSRERRAAIQGGLGYPESQSSQTWKDQLPSLQPVVTGKSQRLCLLYIFVLKNIQSSSSEAHCTPTFGIIASHLSRVWVLKPPRIWYFKKADLKLSARGEGQVPHA